MAAKRCPQYNAFVDLGKSKKDNQAYEASFPRSASCDPSRLSVQRSATHYTRLCPRPRARRIATREWSHSISRTSIALPRASGSTRPPTATPPLAARTTGSQRSSPGGRQARGGARSARRGSPPGRARTTSRGRGPMCARLSGLRARAANAAAPSHAPCRRHHVPRPRLMPRAHLRPADRPRTSCSSRTTTFWMRGSATL